MQPSTLLPGTTEGALDVAYLVQCQQALSHLGAGLLQGLQVVGVLVDLGLMPPRHVQVAGQDLKHHHEHLQSTVKPAG